MYGKNGKEMRERKRKCLLPSSGKKKKKKNEKRIFFEGLPAPFFTLSGCLCEREGESAMD